MAMHFSVLTYNTFKFGGKVDPQEVINRVLAVKPDVVGLQEVFNTRITAFGLRARNAKRLLRLGLEAAGYATCWRKTGGFPGLSAGVRDGLLLAVRRDKWDFDHRRDYRDVLLRASGFDRRGIQCALLRERGGAGRTIAFYNTHLSVGTGETARRRRSEQVHRALSFIHDIETHKAPVASILVGDFNSLENASELQPIRLGNGSGTRFEDTFRAKNSHHPGVTLDVDNTIVRERPKPPEASMRIDYVFLRPVTENGDPPSVVTQDSRVVLTELVKEKNLSDHYGVVTDFELV